MPQNFAFAALHKSCRRDPLCVQLCVQLCSIYVARLPYIGLPISVGPALRMEPDLRAQNCDNLFLHTSESCETLADPTDLFCSNCRVPEFDQSRFNTDTRCPRSICKSFSCLTDIRPIILIHDFIFIHLKSH